MKKFISIFLTIVTAFTCFVPFTAFAADNSNEHDIFFTQEEFDDLEHTYSVTSEPYATGLISDKKLGIAKSGTNNLIIKGKTECIAGIVKCGFSKIIVQRKKPGETSWSKYATYNDLYSNSTVYYLSKSVTVETGYQYRVVATHYAKKSLFSTQKIEATTGALSF